MRIDILPAEQWESLNEQIRGSLGLGSESSVKVSPGVFPALIETILGFNQFFSHKKALGIIKGMNPHFEWALPYLYKDAYSAQGISVSQLSEPIKWVESLKKETNFVLIPEDHPVTGEMLSPQILSAIENKLNDLKIFCIRLSHFAFGRRDFEIKPYSVRICSVSPQVALILSGTKVKLPAVLSHKMNWSVSQTFQSVKKYFSEFSEDRELILDFERNLPEGFFPVLDSPHRVWDRSVISHRGVNSAALLTALGESFDGGDQLLSASLCDWGSINLYDSWWENRPEKEVLRGLMLFSPQAIQSGIGSHIKKAVEKCQISFVADA